MIRRWLLRSASLLGALAALAAAADEPVPAQFQVWGTHGPALAAVGSEWTEVSAEPRVRQLSQPTASEARNGYILFQRPPFSAIYHDTVPASFERLGALRRFAARGQYEPVSFAMHALAALKDVQVTVSGLTNLEGNIMPPSCIDIRRVRPVRAKQALGKRFSSIPFYLEKAKRLEIKRGETAQMWLTVKVPESAAGGDYQGHVRIQVGGETAQECLLVVKVLPFTLPSLPIEAAVSYYPAGSVEAQEKELIDQREHGINANESSVAAQVISRDRHFGADDAEATRKSIKRALALRRKVYGPDSARFPLTVEIGPQVLYEWDTQKNWFKFWPHSPELESDFLAAIAVCQETIRNEGGSAMRLFIMDEPGGHPDTLDDTIYYNRLVKQKVPELQTYVTLGGGLSLGIDELGMLGPSIDLITVNRFDPEICRRLLERKKPYGIYNGGGATEAVTGYTRDRYFFGFYGWKTGAREILQWVYRFGEPWKEPLRANHGYVMPALDGPLPSIPWESMRAGIDDYRYMDLLWRLITVGSSSPDTAKAAAAAERIALEVLNDIDFKYQPRSGVGSAAPACATLDKWRWKIGLACERLLKTVPLERALTTEPKRPGPLELPNPPDEPIAIDYGPELLPNSDFENGAEPWKAVGPPLSRGGLDRTVACTGKTSFTLENGANATGTDVSVCVWGWGGPGPGMTLAAGKTYEFSAMCKVGTANAAKPQIRFAVPQEALVYEEEGEDAPEDSGWTRLWRRITVNQNTKPNYLAVWLQGPGKIWVDSLHLREMNLPPFLAEPEQKLFDATDKNLSVRLKQFGPSELAVKVQVVGRTESATRTIPGHGDAWIDLDPTAFSVDFPAVILETSSQSGKTYSKTLRFTRVVGPFAE